MSKINIGDKITVFMLGNMFSIMIFFIIYTAFAQIFTDFLIQNFDDVTNVSFIVLALLLISFIVSIAVGILICKDIGKSVVYKSSIIAFPIVFIGLIVVSYISSFIYYPEIYTNIEGLYAIAIFPQVIVYFAIYIVGNIFYMYIGLQIIYFILLIILLEHFFEYKRTKYVPPNYDR